MTYAYPAPTNPSVEKCPDCPTMKPIGAKYHAALPLNPDAPLCVHGLPEMTKCDGRPCPPRCCWEE